MSLHSTLPLPRSPLSAARPRSLARSLGALLLVALSAPSCRSRDPEPESRSVPAASSSATLATTTTTDGDPLGGRFDLAAATAGLEGTGPLIATITTSQGALSCELYEDKAPVTVANFVGLARGLRPFRDPSRKWVQRPGYDGTTFHRIVRGFMIQGGDPSGTGAGEPGYVIPDEIWPGAKHDRRGLLCMANRGPNTNGMQFFVLDAAAPHLDGGYTIFGRCEPDAVIEKLAASPVRGDRAVDPPRIESVRVRRGR